MDKAKVLPRNRKNSLSAQESAEGKAVTQVSQLCWYTERAHMGLKPKGALCHIQRHFRPTAEGEF